MEHEVAPESPYGKLLPEGYVPRIADAQVRRYLSLFGAVEIAGTKWCGKTWTACAHGSSITYLIQEVPGWVPPARSPKRLRSKPKRYFADPSLPVAALGLSPKGSSTTGRRSGWSSRTSA